MEEHSIPSDNFGNNPTYSDKQLVPVTYTREIPDYYQQHIDNLNQTIEEQKLISERNSKKQERIIRNLRFRLSLLSYFWFLTVLVLTGVFGWFSFRWYNQLQLQKQLATFSPEKVEEIEIIRNDIKELSKTIVPQLQAEIKNNQTEITKVNAKIDKNQKSMSVLLQAMQGLVASETTDKTTENQNSEVSPTPSPEPTPNSNNSENSEN